MKLEKFLDGRIPDPALGIPLCLRLLRRWIVGDRIHLHHRRLHGCPSLTYWLDHARLNEPFYVLTRRELGAQPVPLFRIERAHEEGPEDARFNVRLVELRCLNEEVHFPRLQTDRLHCLEEVAVEVLNLVSTESLAFVHRFPQQ